MAFLNQFSLTKPEGTDLASGIDGYILDDTKKSLDERYALEHNSLATGGTDPTGVDAQGRHIAGKVGCLFYGTSTALKALVSPGEGSIGYATDESNFYVYTGGFWTLFSFSSETVLADNITLAFGASGSGTTLGMKHDHQQWTTTQSLSSGTNISTDCDTSNTFSVTLTTNATLDNPTNMKDGATYIWRITQGGGGPHLLSYDTAFLFPGGVDPVLSTTAGATDILMASCDGTSLYCSINYDVR